LLCEAGVSLGTVSRVINQHPKVSEENAEKVNQAIKKLGYIIKQGKESHDITNVGLIFLGLDRTLVTLPIISEGIHSVQERLNEHGVNTFIADVPDLKKIPKFIEHNNVDGLILKGPISRPLPEKGTNQLCDYLRKLPTVWILGRPENSWQDHCGTDNNEIGKLAAQYLFEKKHEKIAVINLQPNHSLHNERVASFIWHSKQLGCTVEYFFAKLPRNLEMQFPVSNESSLENMDKLVGDIISSKIKYTAVFVPSDTMANLFYIVCRNRKIQIGKDINIISCNNERTIVSHLEPTLTTININIKDLSYRAVDQLMWRATNPTISSMVSITISPDLIKGDSA
jgi:LacI family transcriptional regulator